MALEFTGEYWIPGKSPSNIENDHLERYRFATRFVYGKKVLDISCGVGYGSFLLAKAGASRVDGVDISEEVIDYAKNNYQMNNLSFIIGNICEYKTDNLYDVIICFETIEHIENYQKALLNLYSLLMSDGVLIISSPNRLISSPRAKSIYDRPSNKCHVREFTIEELKLALENGGFVVDKSDIFGQRQQIYFGNYRLRKLYEKLFKPSQRFNPTLTRVGKLVPEFFTIVARKV